MNSTSTLRTVFTLLAGCLLLFALLLVGVYWRLQRRSHEAGEVLVREAHALTAAYSHVERPPHTEEPLPGSLAEALGPLMAEYDRVYEPLMSVEGIRQDFRDGMRPVREWPRYYREAVEKSWPLIQRVLRATRAERGELPEGLRVLDGAPFLDKQSRMLSVVAGFVPFEVSLQLEDGRADAAVETCLDGLALARDVAYGQGLLGAFSSTEDSAALFCPCADALARAPPASQKRATFALRHIREGLRPLSLAAREDGVFLPLVVSNGLLDPAQLEALPAGARDIATHTPPVLSENPSERLAALFRLHDWPRLMEHTHQLAPLLDLPPAQRAAPLAAMKHHASGLWHAELRSLWRDRVSQYEHFARDVDEQRARLDLLLALALVKTHRAENGAWPTALPSLYPEHAVPLPTALKLEPGKGGTLQLVPEEPDLRKFALTATP